MSPWTSARQRRWGNSPAGVAAMGQAKVDEFNEASKGMALPESAGSRAARAIYAARSSARSASRTQSKAMSRTKRKRLRVRRAA
jgi:hypothetical protein